MTQKLGIEEALDIAMDAELKAQAFYAQAAVEVQDPGGRDLLARLAAFEQHHYQKLSELAQSLQKDGRFIPYEARTLEQFAPVALNVPGAQGPVLRSTASAVWLTGTGGAGTGAAGGSLLARFKDVPGILSAAIDKEKDAGERYQALAEEATTAGSADGQAMFRTLANEEMIHQRVLEDEFFSLSNRGVWGWSGMYGE